MVGIRSQTDAAVRHGDCPSDETLRELLFSPGEGDELAETIAHLDRCEACRDKLDRLAGDERFRQLASQCLPEALREDEGSSSVLQERLSTWSDLEFAASDTRDDDLYLAFLQPCGNPEALGRMDRYEVIEVLGRGGMGLVLKARDPVLERLVAVKVMASRAAMDPKARQRFRREARAAATVASDNTVAIHEVQEEGDVPYLVMEYVPGRSLQDLIDRGQKMAIDDVLRIGADVARGLAAAHDKGLIHRDVKPANILLDERTGAAKISDFGLARAVDDTTLTRHGAVAGTPEYMSPEQAGCEPVGRSTDLFSLGCVLYAMCAGRPPFRGDASLAVLRMIRDEPPTPLGELRADAPPRLVAVIETLLNKSPRRRRYTAQQLADELIALRSQPGKPPAADAESKRTHRASSRRWIAWAAALSLLLLAAAVAAGETAGLWNVMAPVVAALEVQSEHSSPAAAADDQQENDSAKTAPSDPLRVQVLPRNALMKEAIQQEKDELDEEPSPLLVRKLAGHAGPVTGLAFMPKGEKILSCSGWPRGDRTLRLWDAATGEVARKFDTTKMPQDPGISGPREAPGELQCLALSPDGKLAVTGATGGATCVWNVTTGELLRSVDGHVATVYGVAISPNGRRVLSGGRDSTARLWKIETGELIYELKGHRSWVRSVAISPDGDRGLTGGYDGTLRLWNLETGEQLKETSAGDAWVWSCAFSPDGQTAAAVAGSAVVLWDVESGKEIRRFQGHQAPVTSVAFSPDGRQLATGSYDQTVRLWHVATGRQEEVCLGHRDWVWQVAFSPDGRQIASAGGGREDPVAGTSPGIDFAIRIWKVP